MQVPAHFNAALDIRVTHPKDHPEGIPTQGDNFSFSAGDVLYTTQTKPLAWSEFLKEDWIALQVSHATPAAPPTGALPRNPGSVTFQIMGRNESGTGLQKLGIRSVTQDEFIELLVSGEVMPAIGSPISLKEYH